MNNFDSPFYVSLGLALTCLKPHGADSAFLRNWVTCLGLGAVYYASCLWIDTVFSFLRGRGLLPGALKSR